jgi:hypothetical protein
LGVDAHDVAGVGVESPTATPVPGAAPACGTPGDDGGAAGDGVVVPLNADTTILPSPSRNGGTAASTTPTANTVTPMARAGRSMTSFQFLGRRGAGRRGAAEPGRAGAAVRCPYLPSCAKNPAIASRIAIILDWLA